MRQGAKSSSVPVLFVVLLFRINSAECFSVSFFPSSITNNNAVANSVKELISFYFRCATTGICGQHAHIPEPTASTDLTTSVSTPSSSTRTTSDSTAPSTVAEDSSTPSETTVETTVETTAETTVETTAETTVETTVETQTTLSTTQPTVPTPTVTTAFTTPGRPTKSTRRPSTSVAFSQTSYTFSTSSCTAGTTVGTVTASNANNYTISNAQLAISATGQITIINAIVAGSYSAMVTGYGTTGSASVPVTVTVSCGSNPSTGTCAANVSSTYSGPTVCSASSSDLGYPITTPMVSAADITAILDTHNTYRRGVDATDMRKLQWDPCIASSAQAWASKCDAVNPHDTYPDRKAPGFPQGCGQNKASGTSGFLTWKSAVDLWYNEVKDFTYCASTNVFAKVGHYTQVMWAETSLIGCGFAKCGGADVFICNYCTPGNFGTIPGIYCPWKQGTSTTKCSACSTGSGCTAGDCLCA